MMLPTALRPAAPRCAPASRRLLRARLATGPAPILDRPPFALTLGLIKPDLYADPNAVHAVFERLRRDQWEVVRQREVLFQPRDAGAFYAEHQGRFFFDRLVGYMTSGPFSAMLLRRPDPNKDAITAWRALIGPTHPVRAQVNQPQSLRAEFGLTDTRNSFHGSDAPETAAREINFFFPQDPVLVEYLAHWRGADGKPLFLDQL
ncbi:hypothetical protein AMAG_08263 [Allomyces macrogynus ATCC 38327]|uniref:Nucleoside diphosphate kinase n=1 Tax=Allomyces macrogynus (strain ATCC 38327) TaxID=578462 RepID=A0A0L0SL39_ALLM3|nr:hypothetical protein AMAG_08263 [Allomyces macrogynus ATCC 38327]|eukprot:KNE63095.1 hypothetical protein AMAG_08263 [Allomyces macrogynus ATCC 38327]